MARGGWKILQRAARLRRARRGEILEPPAQKRIAPPGSRERFKRIWLSIEAAPPPPWPVSGDPNIIGEHEVEPVRCGGCSAIIPWKIIKGWRD